MPHTAPAIALLILLVLIAGVVLFFVLGGEAPTTVMAPGPTPVEVPAPRPLV